MSTTTLPQKIPQPISQRLRQLRSAISRFLLVDGLSRLLAVVVVLVLVDVVLDRFFKMDLAQRGIMLAVMVAIVLAVCFFRLLKPFSRKVGDDALILQVEDQHSELQESMISAAQLSRETELEQRGYSQALVDATIQHGSQMASQVDFGKAINRGALARNLILLLVSAIGIGAIAWGVTNTPFWKTWFNRNVLLTDDQWPRDTILSIVGVENGTLVLPRGEDHELLVEVSETSRVRKVDVTIEFDDGTSNRTLQKMRRTGNLDDREHVLMFRNVANEFRFRARGGDDVTEWVNVQLVDPPVWSELDLTLHLPEYTGISTQQLPAGGGPHAVLKGSYLSIRAVPNKPLSVANLQSDDNQWPLTQREDGEYSLSIPAADLLGGKYTFDLADAGGLRSSRPASFNIKIKTDRAPAVRASLLGISGLIVPRAMVPVRFTVGDEFAITRLEFDYSWRSNESVTGSVPQSGRIDITDLNPELAQEMGKSEIKSVAVLDLEPLQVPVGVSLRLFVAATDNNTLDGPGVDKSREFLLRVVSEEELRADLLRREIEQRKAFELILKSQERLMLDLQGIVDQADSSTEMDADATLDQLRDAQRRQKLVGTNSARVANNFEGFLVEVMNNRLNEEEEEIDDSMSIEVRFNERIIQPIRDLDQGDIIFAAQLIDQSQRTVDTNANSLNRQRLLASLGDTMNKQREIIAEMQKILSAMMDSETYQEVVNKLIEIKRNEESVRELTRQQREEAGNRGVFDDEDMFDDPAPENEQPEDDDKKDGDDGR
ncbi:MAG: hypothetical protein ACR2NP_03205 [Pirellulaceae bacterium]